MRRKAKRSRRVVEGPCAPDATIGYERTFYGRGVSPSDTHISVPSPISSLVIAISRLNSNAIRHSPRVCFSNSTAAICVSFTRPLGDRSWTGSPALILKSESQIGTITAPRPLSMKKLSTFAMSGTRVTPASPATTPPDPSSRFAPVDAPQPSAPRACAAPLRRGKQGTASPSPWPKIRPAN